MWQAVKVFLAARVTSTGSLAIRVWQVALAAVVIAAGVIGIYTYTHQNQTSCPPSGTARAAVRAPLALGKHQNIIYIYDKGASNGSSSGMLKRYDVTTGRTTEIVKLADAFISQAQVSADGQWVLFTSHVNGQPAIQMVRMDGQGLQTLLCVSPEKSISYILWSLDQKSVVFSVDNAQPASKPHTNGMVLSLYLLDLVNGKLQLELSPPTSNPVENIQQGAGYYPVAWLDNTKVYVTLFPEDVRETNSNLSILDTANSITPQNSNLLEVVHISTLGWDFDISSDHRQLLLSRCTRFVSFGSATQTGPSSITIQPATGGSEQTIFGSPTLAVIGIKVISSTGMLFYVENYSDDSSKNVDTGKNGIWKVNIDGSGLSQLTSDWEGSAYHFYQLWHSPWASISRDGAMYAYSLGASDADNTITQFLKVGSLSGGTPTIIASIRLAMPSGPAGGGLAIVGWTTM